MKKILLFVLVAVFVSCSDNGVFNIMSDFSAAMRYGKYGESFNKFWNNIDTSYAYINDIEQDWKNIYENYMPQMGKIKSDEEFINTIREILSKIDEPSIVVGNYKVRTNDSITKSIKDQFVSYQTNNDMDTYSSIEKEERYAFNNFLISFLQKKPVEQYEGECVLISLINNGKCNANVVEIINNINLSSPKGYIIDLRTPYIMGLSADILNIISCFYSKLQDFYITDAFMNTQTLPIIGRDIVKNDIPVVILINKYDHFAANIIAYMFASLPNVKIVGRAATQGGALAKYNVNIGNGFTMTYSNYDIGNSKFESFGKPLQPDYLVEDDNQEHARLYDKCVDVALSIIYDEK